MAECNGHNHKFPDLINNKLIICIKWAYLVSEGVIHINRYNIEGKFTQPFRWVLYSYVRIPTSWAEYLRLDWKCL